MTTNERLTVAVTGPTGEIGRAFLRALDRRRDVGRVLGMARREFDPSTLGLRKTEYRQGDVLDRDAVDALAEEADVLVHLAFIIMGGREETRAVNLQGSRNVFAAAAAARNLKRLVYTASVAAYGFHADNPQPLTEDVPPRGSERFYYSAQKAELERVLEEETAWTDLGVYVVRPCIVAGPDAPMLKRQIPLAPGPLRWALGKVPELRPVLPDPGVPFQLVHHDDVAAALTAAVLGHGPPGVYNLAGPGELTISDLAHALGWHAVPAPHLAVGVAAEAVSLMPFLPDEAAWIEAVRRPVLMDTTRARRKLHWMPHHDARATLRQTIAAVRTR